jgi:hypothetical protein
MTPAEMLNPAYWTRERVARVERTSPRTFTMHVRNEFGGAGNSVIGKPDLDACIAHALPEGMATQQILAACDPSKLRNEGDGFCYVIGFFARAIERRRLKWVCMPGTSIPAYPMRDEIGALVYEELLEGTILRIAEVGGWEGEALRSIKIEGVVRHLAGRLHAWGCDTLFADDFESTGLGGLFRQLGINYRPYRWTEASKMDAIGGTLRRFVRDRAISIVPHAELYRELLSIREVPRPGERWGYETRGLDYASALIALMHALNDPELVSLNERSVRLEGAPHAGPPNYRRETSR